MGSEQKRSAPDEPLFKIIPCKNPAFSTLDWSPHIRIDGLILNSRSFNYSIPKEGISGVPD